MLLDIGAIKMSDRIRKDFGNIEELADDIKTNGLINPPVVTPEHMLIAGERRLKACRLLGYQQIEVRVMSVKDFEHQLRLEISENENRKEFSFTERIEWARRLEQVESLKARERMTNPLQNFAEGATGITRDKVAAETGFGSGENYRKAKFVADNADPEIVRQVDAREMSIHRAHEETKAKLAKAELERDKAIKDAISLNERANDIREENERLKREKSPEPKTIEKVVHAIPDETKRELELLKENARKWREEAQNAQTKAAQAETEIQQYRETLGELSDAQLRKNQRHAVIDRIKWFRGEVGQRLKQLDVEAQELRTDIEVRREVENCALALNRAASEMREWLEEIHPKEVVYDAGTFASG